MFVVELVKGTVNPLGGTLLGLGEPISNVKFSQKQRRHVWDVVRFSGLIHRKVSTTLAICAVVLTHHSDGAADARYAHEQTAC